MIVDFVKNYKNTDYVDRQQIARKNTRTDKVMKSVENLHFFWQTIEYRSEKSQFSCQL